MKRYLLISTLLPGNLSSWGQVAGNQAVMMQNKRLSFNFDIRKLKAKALLALLFLLWSSMASAQSQTFYSNGTFTVPAGVSAITITGYGGGGGYGGQDCGAGCNNNPPGPVGYVSATYNVSGGTSISVYPGGAGSNGANNAFNGTGGGSGGSSSAGFNGGYGGNAGSSGASGGGGGGGAATSVYFNSAYQLVAGGAGGGGGACNTAGSGTGGTSSTYSDGSYSGGTGATVGSADGGGGGGGGGGYYGSYGGGLSGQLGSEHAGLGGYRGNNSYGSGYSVTNTTTGNTGSGGVTISYTAVGGTAGASPSSICSNGSSTISLTGYAGTIQWQISSDNSSWSYTGGSSSSFSTGALTATRYYRALISGVTYSSTAMVTVNYGATTPASASCSGTTSFTANLSWGTATGTGTITYYWVVGTSSSVSYGSGTTQGTTTAPTTSVTTSAVLTPSTTYYLRVYASTSCGNSGYQTSAAFTTVPLAPAAGAATLVRANSFSANWAASTGATNYYLDISTDNFSTYLSGYQNKSVGNVLTYSLSGLNRSTTYYYRVRAYNAGGSSVNSNTISFATLPINNFLVEIAGGGDIPVQLAGQPFSVKITAMDAFNSTVTDFTGTVTITTNSTLTSGGTTATFTAGILSSNSVTLTLAGTLKTLTVTNGSIVSTSNTFTITPAAINHWTLSVDGSGTVTAGIAFTVTATVYDQFGNIKTNYNGLNSVNWTTTATSSANITARILPANGNQTFTNGMSAGITGFTFFNSDQSQLSPFTKPTITITDGPSAVAGTTAPITVKNAELDNFKVVAGTSQAGGVPFSVTVTARDVYWNTCIDYTGSIRFKSSNDALVTFPSGLQSFAVTDQGVKTFINGIDIDNIGAYWVRAADSQYAYKSGDQQNIVVGPGAFSPSATISTMTVDYTTRVAGEFVFVTIIPHDAHGNLLYACRNISVLLDGVASDYNGPIVVTNVGDGSYTALVRVTSTTAPNVISAKLDNTAFIQTWTIAVTPAIAAYFAITGSGTQIAGSGQPVTVTAYDTFNNMATGYTGAKTLTFTGANISPTPPTSPTVAGIAFGTPATITFISGVATVDMNLYMVETAMISATDGTINSTGHVLQVVVSPAVANYLAVTGTMTQIAGVSQTITVTAYDAYNNVATGYTGAHSLTFTGANPALTIPTATDPIVAGKAFGAPITLTFTGGVTSGSMILYKAETALVTATDGTISSTGHELSIGAISALAGYLAITGNGTQVAGASQTITITGYDIYNNVAAGYAGSKALTFSGANVSPAPSTNPTISSTAFGTSTLISFNLGVATGSMILYKVETALVTASDGTINSNSNKLSVVVTPATAGYFSVTGTGTQVAGANQTITITAFDAFNNLAVGYNGSKSLTFTGANPSPAPVTNPNFSGTDFGSSTTVIFTSGVVSGSMLLCKVETAMVTASDGTINSSAHKLSVVVSQAPASYLAISGSGTQIAGASQLITVTAYDVFNNVATGYTGSKVLTFTGANPSLAPVTNPTISGTAFGSAKTLTFASGVSTGNVLLYKTETALVTTTDGSINADNHKLSVLVNPALLKDFLVYGVPSPNDLGTWQSVTVETRDTYNNRKTNYAGTVTFSNTDIAATDPVDYQFITTDLGIHTFVNSVLFSQPGNWWLTAMDLNEPAKYGYQANIIVKRPIIITANIQSKTYGTAMNLGTTEFTVTGTLASGETITNVDLASSGASAGANTGIYDISTSNATSTGTFNAANYDITYSSTGKLTVDPSALTITAISGQSKVYGQTDPALTYSASGFKNGQDVSIITGSLSRVAGENVQTYAVGQGILSAGANYSITYNADNFAITPLAVTVTADAGQTKIYGVVDPTFTYTSNPTVGTTLANSEVISFTGSLTRAAGETVAGSPYAIGIGSVANSNYTIAYTGDNFAITPLAVTVTADAGQTKIYGVVDPTFTYTSNPIVGTTLANSEVISFSGSLSRVTSENVGNYAIDQGTLTNTNYTITYNADNLAITPLAVTVTADAGQTKIYGAVDPTFTYTSNPTVGTTLANSEVISFSGSLSRVTGENVGNYAIDQGTLTNTNYTITYNADNLAITPLAVTVTADAGQTKIYGAVDPTFTYTSNPTVGTTLANSEVISFSGSLSRVTSENVGNYAIDQGTLTNTNYTITYNADNLAITPLAVTVTADAGQTKIYGAVDPTFTYTSNPTVGTTLANSEVISFTGSLTRAAGETVAGSPYAIGIGSVTNSNYTIAYTGDNFAITPLAVTVTADAGQTKIYGAVDPTFTYTSNPTVRTTLANSEVISFTGSLTRAAGETVAGSPYAIGIGSVTNSNYTIAYTGDNFAITPLAVTVTADAGQTKIYGVVDPTFTYTSNPTVGTTLANSEVISFSGSLSRVTGENVGNYAIDQGTLTNTNYTITYNADNLAITPLAVTVTADAGQTKIYGAVDPTFTYTSNPTVGTTLANSEVISFSGSLSRVTSENVGNYAIDQGTLTNTNYTITYNADNLAITPLAVTVTADAGQTKIYGVVDPTFTYTSNPTVGTTLANSEVISFSGSLSRVTGENVGSYPITLGGLSNPNLSVSLVTDNFIITKAPLTVTADNQSKTYGAANPLLTISYSGFVNGEDSTVIVLSSIATTALTGSDTGTYPITLSGGSAANYMITLINGIMTVNKANLTITADNLVKTYGEVNPSLTYTYSGFVGTDDQSVIDIAPTATTSALQNSNAGNYSIVPSGGSDNNYSFIYINGSLTVNKAPLTATADNKVKTYGDANPALTISYSGFVNNDNPSSIKEPSISTASITGSSTGTYPITLSGDTTANYMLTLVNGIMTINQSILTVTADNKVKTYGEANPVLTLSYSGFKGSDDKTVIDMAPIISTSALQYSVPDTFAIIPAGGTDNNYLFTYVDGTLTVNKADLTFTADNLTRDYLADNPLLTFTMSGFLNGKDQSVINVMPSIETTAIQISDADDYPITISGGTDSCYNFVYQDGTLTIGKIPQTITFTDIPASMLMRADYNIVASSTSDQTVLFESIYPQFATVSDDQLVGVSRGTARIRAYILSDQDYLAAEIFADVNIISTQRDILHLFTPNNDGFNDTWEIPDLASYGKCDVRVFNRWGKEVYANKDYDNLWDGTSNGKPLPDGAYYFIIKTENAGTISGTVNIVR